MACCGGNSSAKPVDWQRVRTLPIEITIDGAVNRFDVRSGNWDQQFSSTTVADPGTQEQLQQLDMANNKLRAKIDRVEDKIKVLTDIATAKTLDHEKARKFKEQFETLLHKLND